MCHWYMKVTNHGRKGVSNLSSGIIPLSQLVGVTHKPVAHGLTKPQIMADILLTGIVQILYVAFLGIRAMFELVTRCLKCLSSSFLDTKHV